jgi:cell division protein FtsI (penicillin-binding protein 3)
VDPHRRHRRRGGGGGRRPPRRRQVRFLRLGDPSRRLTAGFAAVCTLLAIVGGRLVQLQALDGPRYAAAAQQQRLDQTVIPAERGRILDREGRVLAYTVAARTVYADPSMIAHPRAAAAALAPLLRQPARAIEARLKRPGRYVVLARDVTPTLAARILSLRIDGIGAQDASQRIYPGRSVAAGVLGFVGRDGEGLAGIERSFDDQLAGTEGRIVVETGERGEQIPIGTRTETAAVPGSSVRLTIAEDLQYVAQKTLDDAVRGTNAKGGQVVVLDARTGEVLAMASSPTYDAQRPGAADPARLGNPAVQAVFEPGSANKVVTFAAALDRGLIRPETPMSVPDSIRVADRVIHDAWSHAVTNWTAAGVIAKSSNVGTLMIAQRLGPEAFYDYVRRFGVGTKTGIPLPAESGGLLPPPEKWSGSTFGNLPIGQGLSMTALQLAGIFQTIANDGERVTPIIVDGVIAPDGTVSPPAEPARTAVIGPDTARTLRRMLEGVTREEGTGPTAAIPGYRVAGKTGTAQKPNPRCRCYSGGGYWATFAGMAPAEQPELVVSVVIDDARGGLHGGAVAAPVFRSIMSYALAQRGVPPTDAPLRPYRLTHG